MKKFKISPNHAKRYRRVKITNVAEVPVLSVCRYSQTTRKLNKKRKMISNNLSEASKKIENELRIRYD